MVLEGYVMSKVIIVLYQYDIVNVFRLIYANVMLVISVYLVINRA
jgi:hypothetical protein